MRNKVTIIIPVYNCEEYLWETLGLISHQTYKNLEIIVIDDGSTDQSGEICERFSEQDNRVRVYHHNNNGVSAARNFGLEQATGDWIAFVDADDLVRLDYVEILMNSAEKYGEQIVKCKHVNSKIMSVSEFKGNIHQVDVDMVITLEEFNTFDHYGVGTIWSALYKAKLAKQYKFRSDLRVGEDSLYFYQLLSEAGKLVVTEKIGYFYRISEGSLARSSFQDYQLTEIQAWKGILNLFEKHDPVITDQIHIQIGRASKELYYKCYKSKLMKYRNLLYTETKTQLTYVLESKKLPLQWKAKYMLFILMPNLISWIKSNSERLLLIASIRNKIVKHNYGFISFRK